MPNQRAKNKVFFGGFIERGVKARLTKAAAAAGMRGNVFGFAMAAVEERLEPFRRSRSKRQLGPEEQAASGHRGFARKSPPRPRKR
jgi:hypothetical protein